MPNHQGNRIDLVLVGEKFGQQVDSLMICVGLDSVQLVDHGEDDFGVAAAKAGLHQLV